MVKIRLSRRGSKDRPFYKIVAVDSRARRDGRFIEQVGTYNPMAEGLNFKVDVDKVDAWVAKGAKTSDTVNDIVKKARKAAMAAE